MSASFCDQIRMCMPSTEMGQPGREDNGGWGAVVILHDGSVYSITVSLSLCCVLGLAFSFDLGSCQWFRQDP